LISLHQGDAGRKRRVNASAASITPVPAILRVLRRCAARRCALVSFAALRAALILRARF